MQATAHNTRRDTGRWTSEPGYLADIPDPAVRRAHRNAVRAMGLREARSSKGAPSHAQMTALLVDAVALLLTEDAAMARDTPDVGVRFARCLRTATDIEGWRLDEALKERVRIRLQPEAEDRIEHHDRILKRRSEAAVAEAREQAQAERRRILVAQRLRRHGFAIPEADDPFDCIGFDGNVVEE